MSRFPLIGEFSEGLRSLLGSEFAEGQLLHVLRFGLLCLRKGLVVALLGGEGVHEIQIGVGLDTLGEFLQLGGHLSAGAGLLHPEYLEAEDARAGVEEVVVGRLAELVGAESPCIGLDLVEGEGVVPRLDVVAQQPALLDRAELRGEHVGGLLAVGGGDGRAGDLDDEALDPERAEPGVELGGVAEDVRDFVAIILHFRPEAEPDEPIFAADVVRQEGQALIREHHDALLQDEVDGELLVVDGPRPSQEPEELVERAEEEAADEGVERHQQALVVALLEELARREDVVLAEEVRGGDGPDVVARRHVEELLLEDFRGLLEDGDLHEHLPDLFEVVAPLRELLANSFLLLSQFFVFFFTLLRPEGEALTGAVDQLIDALELLGSVAPRPVLLRPAILFNVNGPLGLFVDADVPGAVAADPAVLAAVDGDEHPGMVVLLLELGVAPEALVAPPDEEAARIVGHPVPVDPG